MGTKVCERPAYVLHRYINPAHTRYLSQFSSIIDVFNGMFVYIEFGLALFRKVVWSICRTVPWLQLLEITKYDSRCIPNLKGLRLLNRRTPAIRSQNAFLTAIIWSSDCMLWSCSSEKDSLMMFSKFGDSSLCFWTVAYSETALYARTSRLRPGTAVARSVILLFSSCNMRFDIHGAIEHGQ